MNPTNAAAPFASVGASKDLSLVAFTGALLTAFALSAGALLPRLDAGAGAAALATRPATPAVLAATAPEAEPCPTPRG